MNHTGLPCSAVVASFSIVNHVVDSFPLTKLKGGLCGLFGAGDDTIEWLESTATPSLAK